MENIVETNFLIAKKTEKVVTAVYLISQFLTNQESLKIDLRETANQLLREVSLFAYNEDRKDIFTLYKNSLDLVSLLILYLSLARNTKLISNMNCEIVIEALRSIEDILVKEQFRFNKQSINILEEDLFYNLGRSDIYDNEPADIRTSYDVLSSRNLAVENKVNLNQSKKNKNINDISNNSKRQTITINDIKNNLNDNNLKQSLISKRVVDSNQSSNTKDIHILKETKSKSVKKSTNRNKKSSLIKESRRDQILNIFARGVEVSINDIAKKVIGCSIKTIQRELNILLEEGKITKIGEKR